MTEETIAEVLAWFMFVVFVVLPIAATALRFTYRIIKGEYDDL